MKKATISMLLALAIVFSLVLVAAPAAQAAEHTNHCVCGGKAVGLGDHSTCTPITDWQPMTQALVDGLTTYNSSLYAMFLDGNYYLTEDITLPHPLCPTEGKTLTICLNGHTLAGKARGTLTGVQSQDCRAFAMPKKGVLNITDCAAQEGSISGDSYASGGVFKTSHKEAFINIYAGTINGSKGTAQGGAILIDIGNLNFYSGTIQNGSTIGDGKNGGNIQLCGTMNMYGGTIKGGEASGKGGNLNVYSKAASNKYGVFNMYGGVIEGGKALTGGNFSAYNLDAEQTKINIYGGAIKGGTATGSNDNMVIQGGIVKITNVAETLEFDVVKDKVTVDLSGLDSAVTVTKNAEETSYKLAKAGASSSPSTGDSANLTVMGLGLVLGVAGMACLLPKKQKV